MGASRAATPSEAPAQSATDSYRSCRLAICGETTGAAQRCEEVGALLVLGVCDHEDIYSPGRAQQVGE
jgi:hypothetical protein